MAADESSPQEAAAAKERLDRIEDERLKALGREALVKLLDGSSYLHQSRTMSLGRHVHVRAGISVIELTFDEFRGLGHIAGMSSS